jgi:hypothetical protein
MRIDKEKLASLSRLSDEELWEVVSGIAAKNGIKLPSNAPLPTDMQKLRDAMSNPDRLNALGALKIISKYKKG